MLGLLRFPRQKIHRPSPIAMPLIRDTAYNSLLKSERRVCMRGSRRHSAKSLLMSAMPARKFWHITTRWLEWLAEAIDCRYLAGQRAVKRSAQYRGEHPARPSYRTAQPAEPDFERDRKEIEIQVLRAGVLRSTAGIAADETGSVYRAFGTCANASKKHSTFFPILNGLYSFSFGARRI